jgi:hypothetical protein
VAVVIAALAVVLVAAITLFVRAYNHTGSTTSAGGSGASSFSPDNPTPADSGSGSATPSPSADPIPKGGVTNYTFPGGLHYTGGSFAFSSLPQHIVRLVVFNHDGRGLIRVGWVAPQSYDAPYGDLRNLPPTWSITFHSVGDKDRAALFVGTDASGSPVTCQIYIDGRLESTQTTLGPYSRQVCLA